MRVRATLLLSILLLPSLASVVAAEPVVGPDEDGAYALSFDVARDGAGSAALALDVARTDAAGEVARGTRDLGSRELPAGRSFVNVSFLPTEGPGDYEVRLLVDGAAGEPLRFTVADGSGAATSVQFEVPDEPTRLELTSDTVNADGKTKLPGDALVTRARLSDGNGASDVERVAWRVLRGGETVAEGNATVTPGANATTADVEAIFAQAPFAAGNHTLTLTAYRGATPLANASRTFVIREVAPVLLNATPLEVVPDVRIVLPSSIVVGDRNGVDAATTFETRVYRGSARAESSGFNASLGAPSTLANESGYGRLLQPFDLTVPANATAGSYRVSFYVGGSLLGSVPVEVRELPRLADVRAEETRDALVLRLNGTGVGRYVARLEDRAGGWATADSGAFSDGATARLAWPSTSSGGLVWTVELLAREGGAPLDERNGTWTRAAPELRVEHPRSTARLPAAWRVTADGYDVGQATATVRVLRWDAQEATGVRTTYAGGRVRLDGPANLEVGRYEVQLSLVWPNGTTAATSWHFEAGPWMRFTLGAPDVSGREARIPLRNDGGVPLARLALEAGGATLAGITLELADGSTVEAARRGDRWAISGFTLAPGAEAHLRARLPDGPLPPGPRALDLRVLARSGGA